MNIGGRIDRGSLSLTEATGRGSAGGVPEADPPRATAAPRILGGGSIAVTHSRTKATRRGSAGGVPEVHPLPGRPPCRECWGVDRSRRRSPGQRPRDEVQRKEDRRRILPSDDRHAVNFGGRIAGGAPLPDELCPK